MVQTDVSVQSDLSAVLSIALGMFVSTPLLLFLLCLDQRHSFQFPGTIGESVNCSESHTGMNKDALAKKRDNYIGRNSV